MDFFDKSKVREALETEGFFIHYCTSNEDREEATNLCEELGEENSETYINIEAPPACNVGAIIGPRIPMSDVKLYGILESTPLKNELLKVRKKF